MSWPQAVSTAGAASACEAGGERCAVGGATRLAWTPFEPGSRQEQAGDRRVASCLPVVGDGEPRLSIEVAHQRRPNPWEAFGSWKGAPRQEMK